MMEPGQVMAWGLAALAWAVALLAGVAVVYIAGDMIRRFWRGDP